jgi:hypothetical protein
MTDSGWRIRSCIRAEVYGIAPGQDGAHWLVLVKAALTPKRGRGGAHHL